jgi:hypothetical protein
LKEEGMAKKHRESKSDSPLEVEAADDHVSVFTLLRQIQLQPELNQNGDANSH